MGARLISEDDLDALLGACDPLDREAFSGARLDSVLAALHESVRTPASPAVVPARRLEGTRYALRRRLVVAAAVAVGVVVVALAGLDRSGGGSTEPTPLAVPPAAAAVLGRLARVSAGADTSTRPLTAREYEYVTSVEEQLNWTGSAFGDRWTIQQQWLQPDGQGRDRSAYTSSARPTSAQIAAATGPAGRILGAGSDVIYPATPRQDGGVAARDDYVPAGLPGGAQALLRTLNAEFQAQARMIPSRWRRQWVDENRQNLLFENLERILTGSTSSLQLAAAYSVLSHMPGIRVLGSRRDLLGRTGLAFEIPNPAGARGGWLDEMIVEPSTGRVLESAEVQWHPGPFNSTGGPPTVSAGTTVVATVYLQRAVVNSIEALPGGGRIPYHGLDLRFRGPSHTR